MGIDHPFHDFDNHAFAAEAVRKLPARGRRRLALLAPPSDLTYHGHTRDGFTDALSEVGLSEVPFNTVSIDHSIERSGMRTLQLMRRAHPAGRFRQRRRPARRSPSSPASRMPA